MLFFSEDREDQSDQQAQEKARHQRKIKHEIALPDVDVSRESPQPRNLSKERDNEADGNQNDSKKN